MTELTEANVGGAADISETGEYNKEAECTEKIISAENSSSGPRTSGDGDLDPLAHLPEHFRKEIEAQATVVLRKVSFKVCSHAQSGINCRNYFVLRVVRKSC
jgi:hypothetical protein